MARTTKQLSGGGKDKFLRSLVDGVSGLPADAAERVGTVLADGITEVRVRRDLWDAQRMAPNAAPVKPAAHAPKSIPTTPKSTPAPPTPAPRTPASFDPFAFSAVAVLTKKGKGALAAQLEAISTSDHLRQLALAQHLALDPAVTDAEGLRAAIIAATERRIAERKAAAS